MINQSLPELVNAFLEALGRASEPTPCLSQAVASRVGDAPPVELRAGLDQLWRLTRNISRETLWHALVIRTPAQATARREIQEAIEQHRALLRRAEDLTGPQTPEERRKDVMEFARRRETSQAKQIDLIEASATQLHAGSDPLDAFLPTEHAYWQEHWCGDIDHSSDALTQGLSLLCAITPILYARLGSEPIFWATLGCVYDALHPDHPQGFAAQIAKSRGVILAERIQRSLADLKDHWLALTSGRSLSVPLKVTAKRLLAYIERAAPAECEAFFVALDLDAGLPPAEIGQAISEAMWARILRKERLSRLLLARAGLYYWHSSNRHRGPSLALAALGRQLEEDDRWEILPLFPLWNAAAVAAEEHRWEFAPHCLCRALMDIGLFVPRISEARLPEIEEFRFDLRFFLELSRRLGEEMMSDSPLRYALWFALAGARQSDLAPLSGLMLVLQKLGEYFHVRSLMVGATLAEILGTDLWSRLNPHTVQILVKAEADWLYREDTSAADYSDVGITYRRGIENEWRVRWGDHLRRILKRKDHELTFGVMLQEMERQRPEVESLKAARTLTRDFLNEAAHPKGLRRQECFEMRKRLLDDGLLRDLLALDPAG